MHADREFRLHLRSSAFIRGYYFGFANSIIRRPAGPLYWIAMSFGFTLISIGKYRRPSSGSRLSLSGRDFVLRASSRGFGLPFESSLVWVTPPHNGPLVV